MTEFKDHKFGHNPGHIVRKDALTCSFCGKSQKEVAKLIAGPHVYICSECIEICNHVIDSDPPIPKEPVVAMDEPVVHCSISGVIKANRDYVDKILKDLSQKLCDDGALHFIHGITSNNGDSFVDHPKTFSFQYLKRST